MKQFATMLAQDDDPLVDLNLVTVYVSIVIRSRTIYKIVSLELK